MSTLATKYKLAELLKATADSEKQVEIVRQVLAEKSAFEPYTAFKRIDRDSKGYVSALDLLIFLRDNDVKVTEGELMSVFQENATKHEDRISYTEFLNMVLPKASGVLRQLATQRETYHVGRGEVLPYEVEYALARVFEREVFNTIKLEDLRADIAVRHDFHPVNLFRAIDIERNGALSFDSMYIFLKDNKVPASEADVLALLRRTDKDVDGKVSLEEFCEALGQAPVRPLRSRSKSSSKLASPLSSKSNSRLSSAKKPVARQNQSPLKSSRKASNVEYNDYVCNSAEKSSRSRSPGHSKSEKFRRSPRAEEIDQRIASKRKPITSPVRNSITKRLQEASGALNINDLNTSVSSSLYQPPIHRTVNPSGRTSSPLRDSLYNATHSPIRRAGTPLRRPASPQRRVESPIRSEIPIRRPASPVRVTASPIRRPASPVRRSGSPLRESLYGVDRVSRVESSPIRREASPPRKEASPLRESYYRHESPLRRKESSPPRKEASPLRDSFYRQESPVRRRRQSKKEVSSPVKGDEEEHLVIALREQIDLDKELEALKIELSLRRDFNVQDAFNFFDVDKHGSITKKDVKDGLQSLEIFPSVDELYLLLRRFDKDNTGLLRFSNFAEMVTPKEAGYADILKNRVPSHPRNNSLQEAFSEQTIYLFKKTLNTILRNESSCESIRQRLNRRPLFNLWEGFKSLDKRNIGYVSANEFKEMLIEHGFFPSQKEVRSLVDRYDKDNDGKVSYSEFIQEITPKSPQKF